MNRLSRYLATSPDSPGGAIVCDRPPADFRREVIAGLSKSPKRIPSKFFYDDHGSRLFEQICALDEYYPTRTERGILEAFATEIAARVPHGAVVIEPGAGGIDKVELLLSQLRSPRCYVPSDISPEPLRAMAERLSTRFPGLGVMPVCADFTKGFHLPGNVPPGPRLAFFPGSTIGNFDPPQAVQLLADLGDLVGTGGQILIGVDLEKNTEILDAAYNDAAGVTAAFNLNLLARINRELGGNFRLEDFEHVAFYNADARRIEMHLRSRKLQTASIDGVRFSFTAGECIHTENSYKFSLDRFADLASAAGLAVRAVWTDPRHLFSVQMLEVQ